MSDLSSFFSTPPPGAIPGGSAALTALPTAAPGTPGASPSAIDTNPVTAISMSPQDIQSLPALNLNLPSYLSTVNQQLSSGPVSQALANFTPDVTKALEQLQYNRILQGSAPYSTQEATAMVNAAGTGKPVTQEPQGNFFENLTGDVTNLAQSLPNLPGALLNEIQQIPTLSERIANAPQTSNPTEFIGNLASMPGFRLIPGSFIAQNFGTGAPGISGLAQHPLYTALDILPYAESAAARSGIVKGAEEAALARATQAAEEGLVPGKIAQPPIRTFLKGVGGEGVQEGVTPIAPGSSTLGPGLTPGPLGQAAAKISDAVANSPVGEFYSKTFGDLTRTTAKGYNWFKSQMTEAPPADAPPSVQLSYQFQQSMAQTYAEVGGWTPEEAAKIQSATALKDPSLLPDPKFQPIMDASIAQSEAMRDAFVAEGKLGEVQHATGPEVYPTDIANKINSARENMANTTSVITDHYAQPEIYSSLTPDLQASVDRLNGALAADHYADAVTEIRNLRNDPLSKFDPLPYSDAIKSISNTNWLEKTNVPARLQPVMEQMAQDALIRTVPDSDPQKLLAVQNQLYSQAGFTQGDINAIYKDSVPTWQMLREQGYDPTWLPATSIEKARSLTQMPKPFDFNPSIASTKARLMDSGGTVYDPVLQLSAQAQDVLNQFHSQRLIDWFGNQFGIKESDLMSRYLEGLSGDDVLKNQFADPTAIAGSWMKEQGYAPWNPDAFMPPSYKNTVASSLGGDQIWVPKQALDALDGMVNPKVGPLGKLTAPLINTFRNSVLTLSPRFYANNLISAGIIGTVGLDNPLAALGRLSDLRLMARDPDAIVRIGQEGVGAGVIEVTGRELHGLGAMPPRSAQGSMSAFGITAERPGAMAAMVHNYFGGGTIRRLWDGLKTAGGNLDALSEDFIDMAGALEGTKQALASGLTRDQAVLQGIEKANSFFGSKWMDLTPTERTVIKSIFPFYGFTRVLLKFVGQLPATHPWRLAIMDNLAKAEDADNQTGLPQAFKKLFYFGQPDENGVIKSIDVGGANPFQDIGSYASMLGFFAGGNGDLAAITRNVNPVLSTALKELGVDTSRGSADLYPELYLDPATGQLATKTGNPLIDLANSVVPQSAAITSLMGKNAQFAATLKTNPEGAGRMLLSNFAIPVYEKDVNMPQTLMKAEATRYSASRQVLQNALKTGDWDEAKQWPTLVPILQKIAALPPDTIKSLSLQSGASVSDAAKAALLPGNMTGQ